MDRSPLFIPLTETRYVTCHCGVAAEQHRPRARLARAPTVARHLRPRLHILTPATCGAVGQPREAVPVGSLLVGHRYGFTVSSVIP